MEDFVDENQQLYLTTDEQGMTSPAGFYREPLNPVFPWTKWLHVEKMQEQAGKVNHRANG